MWTKNFAICLFSAVYQNIFSQDSKNFIDLKEDSQIVFDWLVVLDTLNLSQDLPNTDLLQDSLIKIVQNKAKFENILQKYLSDSKKTYKIVKAILFTFLQELEEIKKPKEEIPTTLLEYYQPMAKKYVRIAQDYVGGENASLVHAVTIKIIQDDPSTFL